MSFKPGARLFQAGRGIFRTQFRQPFARRNASTAADTAPKEELSGFAKLWNSPVGPKTVHFWAPIMKWGVVIAGISDLARPAENLSLSQNASLVATGLIWTRWCFVIRPQNYFLATVNFFLFLTGATQVTRVIMYQQSKKNENALEAVKDGAKDLGATVKEVVEHPEKAAKNAGIKN
ncbi:UPF0041-domain-containing protein [Pseudovirgaria hyperparasitica]|uniref:Mitochondrial pyruvate carrier n=1 Tax=Pseudovirgaria hyperparasitica TaxID=470096 RepID=A0A6A6VRX3_9PEZI|nr:UPF0041-domain-containing protein [Pseudovirgaria hyperparasitica]KAF2753342.1 UPF0041-domain-containing protein [Pseudovirgaria hyperparasitica]